ncbi:MAG: trypsin-like peptidase domain-containing protein [Planctomycetes bacterium]|nr:trypsin-like peptidase domain-containing protein [Planctomycetota bacterium]
MRLAGGAASWLLLALLLETGGARAARAQDAAEEEAILRDAEKIERSLVSLVSRIRESTVAVVRYVAEDKDGLATEVGGGMGSGVVVSNDGKVFTNVHVIEDAVRIEVVFSDGLTAQAELFNKMPLYDFALLRVRRADLRPADFAKTSLVEPGQWVLAAGNPRGLGMDGEPIVTLGIVSGKGRVAGGKYQYHNAVQTDAEINPGNSGGPLFDLNGRVIGINGLISTVNNASANIGVGFTIPADQIASFLPSMLSGETVEPGYSGIQIEPRTDEKGGVMVRSVERRSPADKVGIRPGDRITGLNGKPIDGITAWANEVAMLPGGRTVTLRLVRENRSLVKKLTLETQAKDETPK